MEELDLVESYMASALKPKKLVKKYEEEVPADVRDRIDTLVGIGLSGSLVVPTLARELGLRWLVIRKEDDGSHSMMPAFGKLGRRWLFVDDFVSTGRTAVNALRGVASAVDYMSWQRFDTEFAGVFQYECTDPDRTYTTPSILRQRYIPVSRYFKSLEPEPVTFDELTVDTEKVFRTPGLTTYENRASIKESASEANWLLPWPDPISPPPSGMKTTVWDKEWKPIGTVSEDGFTTKTILGPTGNPDCLAGLAGCSCGRSSTKVYEEKW